MKDQKIPVWFKCVIYPCIAVGAVAGTFKAVGMTVKNMGKK